MLGEEQQPVRYLLAWAIIPPRTLGGLLRAVCTSGRRKGRTARPPPTLHLSHHTNAALTALGGRVHAAAHPGRTPQGPRDPGGFRRRRAAHSDRSGTPPPIIWTA